MSKIEYRNKLLNAVLNDQIRIDNDLSVVFVTKNKYPELKNWQEYGNSNQTDAEIKKLYNKRRSKNTGYSYLTGFSGLIDIDFDWEWLYPVAYRYFGERMETRTIRTPNDGYRALFITDNPEDYLTYKERAPRVEIHGNNGHHVIVYGKVKDNKGELKEYILTKDIEIRKDNQIIQDMVKFLKEINETCSFLEYNCISSRLKNKKNYLTQEQRTSIGGFFSGEKIDINTAIDFFRTCEDFELEITKDHMTRLYDKEFKHPTCEKLRENFNWEMENCKGCDRHSDKKTDIKDTSSNNLFDLSKMEISKIFTSVEKDGSFTYTENINETPIFEVNNQLNYVIPLTTLKCKNPENESKDYIQNTIGVYGPKTGFGFDPLSFNTNDEDAIPIALVSEVKHLHNKNQERIIEECIQEALKESSNVQRTAEFVYTELCISPIGPIQDILYEKFSYYVNLEDEMQYFAAACFVIGTYMFPLFATFGYFIISGEKGAGKGTFLDLMHKTCWNATNKVITPTEATLFRTVKEQLPTMIIDEYHRTTSNAGVGAAIVSIIESGYEKGGVVPRTEQVTDEQGNKRYEVVNNSVYCPKIFATRRPVEADDKGIKIIIPKKVGDETFAKRKKELLSDPIFESIRKDLLKWTLLYQERVLSAYNSIEPTKKLNGREFNVWLPVLAIAKVAFPNRYSEIIKFAEESIAKNRSNTYEKENRVLTALFMLHKDEELSSGGKKFKEESYVVTNHDVKNKLFEIESEGIHHNTIKSAMDNLKLSDYNMPGKYYIKKTKLENLFSERGFEICEDKSDNIKPIEILGNSSDCRPIFKD